MGHTLSSIPKLHPTMKGPEGGVPLGITTPDGKPLWKVTRRRSGSEPMLDKQGDEVWKKSAQGENIVKKRKPVFWTEEIIGYEESEGNNNVIFVQWSPPTAEELVARERAEKIAALGGGRLAELMVDRGVQPEELFDRLLGDAPAEVRPTVHTVTEVVTQEATEQKPTAYPQMYAPGRWRLSNDATLRGTREVAEAAEAALKQPVPEPTLPVMPEF